MSILKKAVCLQGAFLMAGLAVLAPAAAAGESQTNTPCCFTNQRFTGTCEVVPGENETCASILAYLNNQQSVGKNYCANTTVRGGWAKTDCEAKDTSASCGVSSPKKVPEQNPFPSSN